VVDPACGSGAFLVAAFELLAREYRGVIELLAALGEGVDFDPFDEIVTKNLYGVDINAESVEITRLALWLKTARNQHRLQNLEATIKIGDSLIDDKKWTERPFNWRAAFSDVFAAGGFDVVIGNPPYVRMELIKPFKPFLEMTYTVAADRTDLYAYFFEQGVRILKEGGRLGFISSSTFFRSGSGENLRTFLGDNVAVESVIDFGDLQIFEGVTTSPAVLTLRKGDAHGGTLSFMKIGTDLPKDLGASFGEVAQIMPRERLGSSSWQLEDDILAKLRSKITKGKKTLAEVYGAPLYGIKTGLNQAFIIDATIHDKLVKQDKRSAEILKPFLMGENIQRWRLEPDGLFLINTPKGKVDIEKYPAIRDWLLPFKSDLEKRATKQEWWELQQAQLAYQPTFAKAKVLWPIISQGPKFAFDADGYFINDKCFMVDAPIHLVSFLNSKLCWFFLFGIASPLRGGKWRLELREQYLSVVPLPELGKRDEGALSRTAKAATEGAIAKRDVIAAFLHRVLDDLAPPERQTLTGKLERFWTLDFAAFRFEVKKVFKSEIAVKDRDGWEEYFTEKSAEVNRLTAEIEAAEHEVDEIIYKLFDLTPDEISLLENSLLGQY
jgi:hypothetical protein